MDPLMTSDEVASYLKVDVVTIRRLVNRGELSAYRIGSEYRFAPSDLEEYLQRQRIPADAGGEAGSGQGNPKEMLTQWARTMFSRGQSMPLDRFDKFTERARKVLTLSREEAQRLQHNYIGTEHLLLGLIAEGGGVAGRALGSLGVDLEAVRARIEAITGKGNQVVSGEIGLTPRAKKAIELAVDEARRMYHHYLGTEHLLLGLLREGEGIAVHVLQDMGLSVEKVGQRTLQVLRLSEVAAGDDTPEDAEPPAPSYGPVPTEAAELLPKGEEGCTCDRCGAHSPGYFQYCFNCGKSLAHE
jgi:excisionase family DNA binding protein